MAEKSLFWYTDGFTGSIGDGAAPYTQEEFRGYNFSLWRDGVIRAAVGNSLECSSTSINEIVVSPGRAVVAGFPYFSTASETLEVTSPDAGTTGGRVVLRASWASAQVRLAVVRSANGTATIPALTQTLLTTYEIGICAFTIENDGTITISTEPEYTDIPNTAKVRARQGAKGSGWQSAGTGDLLVYEPVIQQVGAVLWTGASDTSGTQAVTFPIEFATAPVVAVNVTTQTATDVTLSVVASATGFTIYWAATAAKTAIQFNWIAIGSLTLEPV